MLSVQTGAVYHPLLFLYHYGKDQQDHKSCDVCCHKYGHKPPHSGTGPAHVQFQCDQTCQGGNGRAETADINTGQQLPPLVRKAGQEHGSGYIADDLAGTHTGQKCIFFKQILQKVPYFLYSAQIL